MNQIPDLRPVLQVDRSGADLLTDSQAEWCLDRLERRLTTDHPLTLAGLNQALIWSGHAQEAAGRLLTGVSTHFNELDDNTSHALVRMCFENIRDLIRTAGPRDLPCARELIRAEERRWADDHKQDIARHASDLRGIVFPLLKTNAAPEGFEAIGRFLDRIEMLPPRELPSSVLANALLERHFDYSPPTDLDTVNDLLKRQRALSSKWIAARHGDSLHTTAVAPDVAALRIAAFCGRDDVVRQAIGAQMAPRGDTPAVELHLQWLLQVVGLTRGESLSLVRTRVHQLAANNRGLVFLRLATALGLEDEGRLWLTRRRMKLVPDHAALFYYRFSDYDRCKEAAGIAIENFSAACQSALEGSDDSVYEGARIVSATVLGNLSLVAIQARYMRGVDQFIEGARDGHSTSLSDSAREVIAFPNARDLAPHLPLVALERAHREGHSVTYIHRAAAHDGCTGAAKDLVVALRNTLDDRNCDVEVHFAANQQNWMLAPEEGRIEYRGANYYSTIHNSIGIRLRRFTLDWDHAEVVNFLELQQRAIGYVHDAVHQFADAVRSDSKEYAIVLVGIQFGVSHAARRALASLGLRNVRILHASSGLEGFGTPRRRSADDSNEMSCFQSVADLTWRPRVPLALRPTHDEAWATVSPTDAPWPADGSQAADYVRRIDRRWTAAERSVSPFPAKRRRVLVLGTVLPDLSIPEDTGHVHQDIADWFRHTVEVAARAPELDLVIKPNPVEPDPAYGFYVTEPFHALAPKLPSNATALPHDSDLLAELAKADLTVLWAGSSVIELALLGVPFLCASAYAEEEYPLRHVAIESRSHYEALLEGREPVDVYAENRRRAAYLVDRITTPPIREPMTAFERALTNGQIRLPQVDLAAAIRELDSPAAASLAATIMGRDSRLN